MIDHSDKKLDYALRAIQHPQLRETDEFLQWIGIPENKELFLELMACKEAVIRENLLYLQNSRYVFLLRTTMMNMWSYKWMVVVNSSY